MRQNKPVDPVDPTDPNGPEPGTPGPLSIDYASSFDFGTQKISGSTGGVGVSSFSKFTTPFDEYVAASTDRLPNTAELNKSPVMKRTILQLPQLIQLIQIQTSRLIQLIQLIQMLSLIKVLLIK
jgi:hypothetical protein